MIHPDLWIRLNLLAELTTQPFFLLKILFQNANKVGTNYLCDFMAYKINQGFSPLADP